MMKRIDIIPANKDGKENDLDHSLSFNTRSAAVACFNRACSRLLHPRLWHVLAGALSAKFSLAAEDGKGLYDTAASGCYIKIDIPGPGTKAGDGHDWVRIDMLEDRRDNDQEEEFLGMRLRPAANPASANEDTAHFFQQDAASVFIIERNGNEVKASYHGRNEVPNTKTGSVLDNARNAMIATGAFMGLSEAQWSALIKGFLESD